MFKVIYYVSPRGENFVRDFILSLPEKVACKVAEHIKYLSLTGPLAKPRYACYLGDKIFELRVSFAHYEPRILYFFHSRGIVLTHGFLKKTRAVPPEEIERAKRIKGGFQ
ncbi:MAG: type II toxin-antitoxin system RelE/ParE family toxin [Elusimicrobiales bacterium]|nr:type II toxin-antitoxin system RelE/ParE family toxin [Elusimicrobiales bacterium]